GRVGEAKGCSWGRQVAAARRRSSALRLRDTVPAGRRTLLPEALLLEALRRVPLRTAGTDEGRVVLLVAAEVECRGLGEAVLATAVLFRAAWVALVALIVLQLVPGACGIGEVEADAGVGVRQVRRQRVVAARDVEAVAAVAVAHVAGAIRRQRVAVPDNEQTGPAVRERVVLRQLVTVADEVDAVLQVALAAVADVVALQDVDVA